jgi:uncharacterized protein with von Willebrand factor type A (vWA) domain
VKERLVQFVDSLREAGVRVSPAETLDAVCAAAAIGIERPLLRAALAAALVKDHADRDTFDAAFDRFFALPPAHRPARRAKPLGSGDAGGSGETGWEGRKSRHEPRASRAARLRQQDPQPSHQAARRLARRRALAQMPFRDLDPRSAAELPELSRELSRRFRRRVSRRRQRARHGRVDLRRTARRALARGGIPLEIVLHKPRPRRIDLLALVDLSHSTATAAEFLLSVLAPARHYFRRARLFGYVDAPAEIVLQAGHVVPVEPLDLHARSDFGAVLRIWFDRPRCVVGRNTLLLILGDARNNRRPPRGDLLARLHAAARAVVWVNPEEPRRWNSGDSVMANYARHVDLLLPAWNAASLARALDRVTRLLA